MNANSKTTKKAFREYLNSLPATKHKHNRFHQISRLYGDYLYAQDREKFNVDYQQWLEAKAAASVARRFESQIPGFIVGGVQ